MSAYIFKLNAETEGKTQKVQNDSRTVTTGIRRGIPGCGPQNYEVINYIQTVKCLKPCFNKIIIESTQNYNGGNPSAGGPNLLNGGNPSAGGPKLLNGGKP